MYMFTTVDIGFLMYDTVSIYPSQPAHTNANKQYTLEAFGLRRCLIVLRAILLTIICYFVWPRVPSMGVYDVSNDTSIVVVTNSTAYAYGVQISYNTPSDNTQDLLYVTLQTLYDMSCFILYLYPKEKERSDFDLNRKTSKAREMPLKRYSNMIRPTHLVYRVAHASISAF
ncbi:hypothetical protein BY458DRAFT_490777 [Sporodiniella umbellata]|nr:hypothetical protein BY458DRAFT_490777 [Sporodiniella umbellata]